MLNVFLIWKQPLLSLKHLFVGLDFQEVKHFGSGGSLNLKPLEGAGVSLTPPVEGTAPSFIFAPYSASCV